MEGVAAPLDFQAVFADICLGQKDAIDFCFAFLEWCHWLDDVIDGEVALNWSLAAVAEINLKAAWLFSTCPFFHAHRSELWPVILNSARAFLDSEAGRHGEIMDAVLKTQYQEVFFHVGRLCGGWDHYAAMTARYRCYML